MSSTIQIPVRRYLPFPPPPEVALRLFTHSFLLGLSVLTLVILWQRAPRFAFSLFLAWTVAFYVSMFIFSWHLRPENSVLSALSSRLHSKTPDVSNTPSTPTPVLHTPASPYTHHQPLFRTAAVSDNVSITIQSVETDAHNDDVDEFTAQRMMEEEMGRRDVSIITIPKRKLWVANPS